MVDRVWAVKAHWTDDPIICFSTREGAESFLDALNVDDEYRDDCIVEMPVLESFRTVGE